MPHTMERHHCPDSGIYCMVLLARFHQLPADPTQLQHEFGSAGQSLTSNDLLRCARHLHLKARHCKQLPEYKLATVPLPAIARQKDGQYVVLASYANDKVLVHDPREQRPLHLPIELFCENWSGELILLARRSHMVGLSQRFGLRWLLPSLVKYRQQFLEVLLASFFLQLFALVTPLFFQVVIDKVLVHGSLTTLDVLAVGLLLVSLFDVVLATLRNYLLAHTSNRIDVTLGARLFNHLLALPTSYFKARRLGDTVARVRELDTIRQFITGSSLTVFIDLFFTAIFFALMFWYSPQLSWIVAASIPCYIALSLLVTPLLRQHLQLKFQRGAENQAFLVEAINGIDTLKSMAVEPQMQRHWEDKLAAYVSSSFRALKLGNIASQIAGFINKVVTIMILWFGATLVIGGALSVGQLVAFNMLAGRVSGPVLRLVQLWQDFQQAGISMERLGDILNAPTESGHNPNRTTPPALQGRIQFDHVGFRYQPDSADVLHDICLEIEPGEVIGIVGHSGSGKSTLARLVQRLYTPSQGRLRIDGTDLSLVQAPWLRRQIGVVQQESFLFNRSVKDNIALADPGLDITQVIAAAKIAGAHEFITELPEGYDTPVGEQGCIFSGGQKQRIAIARALIGDPPILIFDEATSALDYESEYLVQKNMRRICKHRTVLIIAHRLSAVQDADRIIVLSKGRVVEQGRHQQLVGRGGYYAGLFEHQTRGASIQA
jgi:subfamily B ATP-binding cassette protein HlyB/CyaB